MVLMDLSSLLFIISFISSLVSAAPIDEEPLHRLALRKIPVIRDGEHPQLAFQRHHNSAIKRLHHFTRTPPPDDDFFRKRYERRRTLLEDSGQIEKRLRLPANLATSANNTQEKRLWYKPQQQGSNAIEAAKNSVTSVAAKTTAAASAATTTIGASGSNANGLSSADFTALEDVTVLKSSSALIAGGLNYEIESNDEGYIAEVQMGTPPQNFLLLMDSGSSDTWVPSSLCSKAQCGAHQTLGTASSSTFKASTQSFSVTYGSGMVTGNLCADTLSIAGMTLANHVFGVTTQETAQFSGASIPFDGLMGLAFSSLSEQGTATPIDSLASTGQVKQAIMGFALGRVADGENDGEIVFGAADTSKIDAATTQTLPVTSTDGFWQTAMSAVTVNGVAVVTGRQAILDTGTSLMVAPGNDAAIFHAQIPGSASDGSGGFTIPCTTEAVVTMTFGQAAFTIDARDLIFQPVDLKDLTGQCVSSLSEGTIVDDVTWLLGDTFLKNVYMTTNVQANTIQLSARTDSPDSSSANKASVAAATPGTATNETTSVNQAQASAASLQYNIGRSFRIAIPIVAMLAYDMI